MGTRDLINRLQRRNVLKHGLPLPIIAGLFFVAGMGTLLVSQAASPFVAVEAENGTLSNCATATTDSTASGGRAVAFGGSACAPAPAVGTAGAKLPISYSLASLTGTPRYVATNGNDTSGNGTAASPFATLSRAYTAAVSGDPIVIRGGTYRQGAPTIAVNKPVKFIAYPGETPVFNGAQLFNSGWTVEGALKWHAYTPRPVSDANGVAFSTNQNLTGDGVGKYPDQAWVGNAQLKQVSAKTAVTGATFWVDRTAGRIYTAAANADSGTFEASRLGRFIYVNAPKTSFEGFKVARFSNTPSEYGVFTIVQSADNTQLLNIEITDTAFMGIFYAGNSDILSGSLLKNVTITGTGWMSVSSNYTDNLTMDAVRITNADPFDEFTSSPASGALKATKARGTKVINSVISGNKSHGLWCDQSCVDMDIAGNTITGNTGSAVFYEISHDVLIANNYIVAPAGASNAAKLAGASGLKLVNNTIIGGPDAVGIYTDNRSKPGCADPAQPLCAGSPSSDRDVHRPRPAQLDWIPRLDLSLNNIFAFPTANGFCGASTPFCITLSNAGASVSLGTVIHKADALRPQTRMEGDVFANGAGSIFRVGGTGYATPAAFTSAMAAQVGIAGLEAGALAGNQYVNADGSPTATLSGLHGSAVPVPTDANLNQYIPAGTKHRGVLNK